MLYLVESKPQPSRRGVKACQSAIETLAEQAGSPKRTECLELLRRKLESLETVQAPDEP